MKHRLKLHHHKHTGHLIHHRHTSYWALIILVILSGACTLLIQRVSWADTLDVSATVPAPIPSIAAAFLPKFHQFHTAESTVTLEGTCPVIMPAVIIALYSGPVLLGSGICQANGTFAISVALQLGTHTIVAQIVTVTGQTGPTSTPISVTYTPPSPATPSPSTPTKAASYTPLDTNGHMLASVLAITTTQSFMTYRPGVASSFEAHFDGGTLPYQVTITWGDGTSETFTITDHEVQAFRHTYHQAATSPLAITMTDAANRSLTRYYATVNVIPSATHFITTPADWIDQLSTNIFVMSLSLYLALGACLIYLWHYEHTRYRKRIGLPTHYRWQHRK